MEATDLMLGDLVTFKDCQQDPAPVIIRIWQINGADEAFAWINGSDALDEITIDDEIVGIPITLRILRDIKLPFLYSSVPGGTKEEQARKRVETFEVNFGKMQSALNYYIESGEVELTAIRGVRFKFLHELQHAFRLLGVEWEVKLF